MKRNLLLLASLFVGITAFAQWEKPTVKGAEMKFSSEEVGDTTEYYLYNEDACAFFTEGNAWGTQASYTSENTGLKVMFTKDIVDGEWDGKTFFINDFSLNKNSWKVLFIDTDQAMFVDHGTQPNYYWECVQNGDAYRFFGAAKNPTFNYVDYEESYMGIDLSNASNVLFPFLDMVSEPEFAAENYLIDWKLVPVDDAEALLAKIAPYRAAKALKELIDLYSSDEATKETLKADIDKAEKVYEKSDATVDELKAAANALRLAYNYLSIAGATEDNPKDATGFFKNPDFSDGNVNGWDCSFIPGTNVTNLGYQGASYTNGEVTISGFIEAWTPNDFAKVGHQSLGDGRLSQTLPSLPAGKYMFSCDAIAISQSTTKDDTRGAYLFAESGEEYAWQTEIRTNNNQPEHFLFTFVTNGDDVTLGLKTETTTANWIAADNFKLIYYGEVKDDPDKVMLDTYIAKIEEIYPEPADEVAQATVKEAYIVALEAAKAATEGYKAAQATLEAAFAAFDSSVKAYAEYMQKITEIRDDLASYSYSATEAEVLSDYLMEGNEVGPDKDMPNGSAEYIIVNGTLNEEQLKTEIAWVNNLFQTVIANSLQEGDDCTKMLVNPNFADGAGKGWTKNADVNITNLAWTGGLVPNFPCAESWHSYFDIYQDVVAPDGIYALSLNGFCRLDDGVDTDVPAEIYMNTGATKLMNILEDKLPLDEANDGFNCYLSAGADGNWTTNPIFEGASVNAPADNIDSQDEEGYWPNGMTGASVAFSADRYKATVYGIISGGKMRVGVRNTKSTHVWALWGNFKLTFMGKNQTALMNLLEKYIPETEELLDSPFEGEVKANLNKAYETAKAALSSLNADEMYDALLNLVDLTNDAKASIEAYESFSASITTLQAALDEHQETAKQEAVEAGSKLLDEVLAAYEEETANAAKVAEYQKLIEKAVAQLRIPAVDPTDDDPLTFTDWIVNPAYDDGTANGWILTSENRTNMGYQNNNVYTDEATLDQFAEVWGNGFALGDSFIRQTILYLPEGTYKLEADAIAAHDVETTGMYLFAYEGDATNISELTMDDFKNVSSMSTKANMPKHFALIFKKESADTDLTIGAMTKETNSNWLAVDNFALTYYGKNSHLDPSGIIEVNNAEVLRSNVIFNLAGQRINSLQKGINIVGGKKVFVK